MNAHKNLKTIEDIIDKYDIKIEHVIAHSDNIGEITLNLYESDLFIKEWNRLLPPSLISDNEIIEGIEVTFLSHSARPFINKNNNQPDQMFSWLIIDAQGNYRLLVGSIDFAQKLWNFCVANNISSLFNKTLKVQKLEDKKYIFSLVE